MEKLGLAGLLAILAIGGAQAQTTTCNRIGDSLYCNRSHPPDYNSGEPEALKSMADPAKANAYVDSIYESAHKAEAEQRRKRVGSMVAAGQCAQARSVALQGGDFALAHEVEASCHP